MSKPRFVRRKKFRWFPKFYRTKFHVYDEDTGETIPMVEYLVLWLHGGLVWIKER